MLMTPPVVVVRDFDEQIKLVENVRNSGCFAAD